MKYFIFLFLTVSFLSPFNVQAAEFYFGVDEIAVKPNVPVEVGVFLSTEGETMNALSADIDYPDSAEILRIDEGNSLVSLWIDPPKIKDGKIHFEGIVPGGYAGNQMYLFSLFVLFREEGQASLSSTNEKVLLHDGLGTETAVHGSTLVLTVDPAAEAGPATVPVDDERPEPFELIVTHDASLFDDRPVLIFNTEDKLSGIDHYEVRENGQFFFQKGRWVKAESPYLLERVHGGSIDVKAVDKSGNERIASYATGRSVLFTIGLLLLGILFLIFLFVFVRAYLRRVWRGTHKIRSRR
jgi:hypothetical protein